MKLVKGWEWCQLRLVGGHSQYDQLCCPWRKKSMYRDGDDV
jgi:hypothetical protein